MTVCLPAKRFSRVSAFPSMGLPEDLNLADAAAKLTSLGRARAWSSLLTQKLGCLTCPRRCFQSPTSLLTHRDGALYPLMQIFGLFDGLVQLFHPLCKLRCLVHDPLHAVVGCVDRLTCPALLV